MDLISYGSVSKDFKVMAQLTNLLNSIKQGEVKQFRLDCYVIPSKSVIKSITTKFEALDIPMFESIEVFYPSTNYPSHVDEGGTSYFIALENGNFLIENVSYPIVPFVLYAFEESKLHNTDFGAIMLK